MDSATQHSIILDKLDTLCLVFLICRMGLEELLWPEKIAVASEPGFTGLQDSKLELTRVRVPTGCTCHDVMVCQG